MRYNASAKRLLHAKLSAVSLRSTPCANCNLGVLTQLGFPQISLVLEYRNCTRQWCNYPRCSDYYWMPLLVRTTITEYLNRKGVGKAGAGEKIVRKDCLEQSESENRRTRRHYLVRVRIKLLLRASCNCARFNAFDFRVRKCPPKRWLIIIFPLRDARRSRRTYRLRP